MANSRAVRWTDGAAARGGLPRQIDADRAQGQMPDGFARLPGATEQGADAGQQFAGAERFDQVIVGAGVEPGHAILDLALGGEHEHRDRMRQATQLGAERESIELRQHDVEQQQIGFLLECAIEAGDAVGAVSTR
jgi:hypothetical protein